MQAVSAPSDLRRRRPRPGGLKRCTWGSSTPPTPWLTRSSADAEVHGIDRDSRAMTVVVGVTSVGRLDDRRHHGRVIGVGVDLHLRRERRIGSAHAGRRQRRRATGDRDPQLQPHPPPDEPYPPELPSRASSMCRSRLVLRRDPARTSCVRSARASRAGSRARASDATAARRESTTRSQPLAPRGARSVAGPRRRPPRARASHRPSRRHRSPRLPVDSVVAPASRRSAPRPRRTRRRRSCPRGDAHHCRRRRCRRPPATIRDDRTRCRTAGAVQQQLPRGQAPRVRAVVPGDRGAVLDQDPDVDIGSDRRPGR